MSDHTTAAFAMPSIEQLEAELSRVRGRARRARKRRTAFLALLTLLILALLAAALFMPILQIRGNAMAETLREGDMVLGVGTDRIRSGDVIGFDNGGGIIIKRVIAIAGDRVDMDGEGRVTVNGVRLDEPYLTETARGSCNVSFPLTVPEGCCFILGDNRAESIDSRNTAVGCLSVESASCRILLRLWPFGRFGPVR